MYIRKTKDGNLEYDIQVSNKTKMWTHYILAHFIYWILYFTIIFPAIVYIDWGIWIVYTVFFIFALWFFPIKYLPKLRRKYNVSK